MDNLVILNAMETNGFDAGKLVELKEGELRVVEGGFNPLYFLAGLAVLAGWAHDATCGRGPGESCTWAGESDSEFKKGGYPGMNFF